MRCRFTLVMLLLVSLPLSASAGFIFGKKTVKPTPQERVPELIKIVKTDGDENKRYDAVEELRQYEPAQFPEIVPTLIDALLNDKKASVRSEAAYSLSKLRPVSQQGGQALEMALANDSSMRVRIQARSSLLSYQWAGYRNNGKKEEALAAQKEPPLADPLAIPPMQTGPSIIPTTRLTPVPQTPPATSVRKPSTIVPAKSSPLEPPLAPVPVPAQKPAEPKGPDLGIE